jgi:hypothetical protein
MLDKTLSTATLDGVIDKVVHPQRYVEMFARFVGMHKQQLL